ncbi:MAG: hypothetical protein EPN46_02495 [Candidimonas sp.]|nr:MAG: hypothetical protein EPN62_12345 [Candidimonas sp.]TAM80202.1 MAG: hypothetical protein EPN46_02495 [Candidimonas sp.]
MKKILLLMLLLCSSGARAENVFVFQPQNNSPIWVLTLKKCQLPIADAPYMHHFEMRNIKTPTDGCWGETLDGSLKIISITHKPAGAWGPNHSQIAAHNFVNVEMNDKAFFTPATIDKSGKITIGRSTKVWGYAKEPKPATQELYKATQSQPIHTGPSNEIKILLRKEARLNDICRDQSDATSKADNACEKRDAVYAQLNAKGWCWQGPGSDPSEAEKSWQPCTKGAK